jgi:phospholipid/cholesterol/gamma-HCH transport system ATP-binding protein
MVSALLAQHVSPKRAMELMLSARRVPAREALEMGMLSRVVPADELAAEADQELPPLPPIPLQQEPSNGIPRRSQRPPGEWCRENGVTPPPGSFEANMSMAPGA